MRVTKSGVRSAGLIRQEMKKKRPDDEQTPMKRSPSKEGNDVGKFGKRGSNVVIISVPAVNETRISP